MAKFTLGEVCGIPDEAFQPTHLMFPRRQFGVSVPVNRSFQAAWFNGSNGYTMMLGKTRSTVFYVARLSRK